MRFPLPLIGLLLAPQLLWASPPRVEISPDVQSFLESTCFRCHVPEKQKGDVRLDTLDTGLGDPASAQLWQDVLDIINTLESLTGVRVPEKLVPEDPALCNLWLTLLQTCEVPIEQFGDSDSRIEELFG